ncbi:HEAT repeat-containing protein [Actinidia rufa]|uniref:HEAT repeat-containing protein n=1 Tax=Actinidia rufa TaxID=165716 RepID=A0A7J0ERW5_9ERIC|nr:HEAT repeat-containing protein [Actinidia rufa]
MGINNFLPYRQELDAQSILAEGNIIASQHSAASGGLGLLARLGNDIFTANYAGGMSLSSLVPATVNSISLLAKSSISWSTGLARLGPTSDILLSEENGWVDLQQGLGHLINASVVVLGSEIFPSSIFFSHCKDSNGILSLLGMIDQCLKAGKKIIQASSQCHQYMCGATCWIKEYSVEGDINASQCSAASGGLGLDTIAFGDVTGAAIDASYVRSIAFALGYIHCSAGGIALSNLVPATVNSISLLAKSPLAGLQARLGLTSDILLSEENGWVDLQQGVGHLINVIFAVLGPELSPASISFSHYKVFLFYIYCYLSTAVNMLDNDLIIFYCASNS